MLPLASPRVCPRPTALPPGPAHSLPRSCGCRQARLFLLQKSRLPNHSFSILVLMNCYAFHSTLFRLPPSAPFTCSESLACRSPNIITNHSFSIVGFHMNCGAFPPLGLKLGRTRSLFKTAKPAETLPQHWQTCLQSIRAGRQRAP